MTSGSIFRLATPTGGEASRTNGNFCCILKLQSSCQTTKTPDVTSCLIHQLHIDINIQNKSIWRGEAGEEGQEGEGVFPHSD